MSTPHHPPSDYAAFVLAALTDLSRREREKSPPHTPPLFEKPPVPPPAQPLDQSALRYCLYQSSSYLVADATTNPAGGLTSWNRGFNRLIDVLDALHARGELELETVNAASRACSECWSVAGNWRALESSRDAVRAVATRLKKLLDDNGKTFRGARVYAP